MRIGRIKCEKGQKEKVKGAKRSKNMEKWHSKASLRQIFLRLNSTPNGIYYENKYCALSPATLTEHTKYAGLDLPTVRNS